jgi:putative ABC transport system permease protein
VITGELWRRLVLLVRRDRFREELEEEMRLHQALRAETQRETGMSPEAAADASRRAFGNFGVALEASQDIWGGRWVDALGQDLKYAFRLLRRAPVFAISVALTLSLGVGTTAAMFGVVDGVLLRPLPIHNQERVVVIWTENQVAGFSHMPLSRRSFEALRKESTVFDMLAAVDYNGAWSMIAQVRDAELPVKVGVVAGDFFGVLGVRPLAGRALRSEDDMVGAPAAVVIGDRLWRDLFAASPSVVGQQMKLSGRSYTIVGVVLSSLGFPKGAELWVPTSVVRPQLQNDPNAYTLDLIGRLGNDIKVGQARAELNILIRQLASEDAALNADQRAVISSFYGLVVGDVRTAILILTAGAGLVLIIALANVANLLTVRAAARHGEFSIRASIGADRSRIRRQLITESLAYAVFALFAAAAVANWALPAVLAAAPRSFPRLAEVGINARVFGFSAVVTLIAVALCGGLATRTVGQIDLMSSLRSGSFRPRDGRTRRMLVAGQVAVSVVVLSCAGLLVRTLRNLQHIDLGFDAGHLMLLRPSLPFAKFGGAPQVRDAIGRIIARVEILPGVRAVTPVLVPPFAGTGGYDASFSVEGEDQLRAGHAFMNYEAISSTYLPTLKIRLVSGRNISEQDREGSVPVALVNESFARIAWPGQSPLRRRVKIGDATSKEPWREVVGVVADTRYRELRSARPTIYLPYEQQAYIPLHLLIRVTPGADALGPALRRAVKEVDPDILLGDVMTLDQILSDELAQARFNTVLLNIFAMLALLLAAIGLYGVVAEYVARRNREIGIRITLGANAKDVIRLVFSQGIRPALFGVAVGMGAALVVTRGMTSELFGVAPGDPATLALIAILFLLVASIAVYVPTRRATMINPLQIIKSE